MYPQAVDQPPLPAFVHRMVGRHCGAFRVDPAGEDALTRPPRLPTRGTGVAVLRRGSLRRACAAAAAAAGPTGASRAKVLRAGHRNRAVVRVTHTGKLVQLPGTSDVLLRARHRPRGGGGAGAK